jgi:hypothetical protein
MLIAYFAQVAPSSCPVITTAFAIRRSVWAGKTAGTLGGSNRRSARNCREQERIDADSPGRLNVELLGLARLGSAP